MKSNVILSIIIPVYNAEKYLNRCITSIQIKNREVELILINDGSVDNSFLICNRYLKYENVIIIDSINEGVSAARNKGIKKARGDYIVFLDSDDYVIRNYVPIILDNIKKNNFDVAIFGYYINFEEKKRIMIIPPDLEPMNSISSENIHKLYQNSVFNLPWNKIYKKSIIFEHNIVFDEKLSACEDFIFNCEYFQYVKNTLIMKQPLYNYMKQGDENTLVSKYHPNLFSNVNNAIGKYKKLMNSLSEENDYYNRYLAFNYLFSCIPNLFKGSKNPQNDFKDILNEMKVNNVFNLKISKNVNFKILKLINKFPNFLSYRLYVILIHLYWKMKGVDKR